MSPIRRLTATRTQSETYAQLSFLFWEDYGQHGFFGTLRATWGVATSIGLPQANADYKSDAIGNTGCAALTSRAAGWYLKLLYK